MTQPFTTLSWSGASTAMGSSSSKAARRLPTEKPSWAGARSPSEQGGAHQTRRSMPSRPLAFENKTDGALQLLASLTAY